MAIVIWNHRKWNILISKIMSIINNKKKYLNDSNTNRTKTLVTDVYKVTDDSIWKTTRYQLLLFIDWSLDLNVAIWTLTVHFYMKLFRLLLNRWFCSTIARCLTNIYKQVFQIILEWLNGCFILHINWCEEWENPFTNFITCIY